MQDLDHLDQLDPALSWSGWWTQGLPSHWQQHHSRGREEEKKRKSRGGAEEDFKICEASLKFWFVSGLDLDWIWIGSNLYLVWIWIGSNLDLVWTWYCSLWYW